MLGDKEYGAQPGALVFIPAETWISLKNIGKENISLVSVWNEPGFEELLRCVSVRDGVSLRYLVGITDTESYPITGTSWHRDSRQIGRFDTLNMIIRPELVLPVSEHVAVNCPEPSPIEVNDKYFTSVVVQLLRSRAASSDGPL